MTTAVMGTRRLLGEPLPLELGQEGPAERVVPRDLAHQGVSVGGVGAPAPELAAGARPALQPAIRSTWNLLEKILAAKAGEMGLEAKPEKVSIAMLDYTYAKLLTTSRQHFCTRRTLEA